MPPAADDVVLPALLRAARGSYARAIRGHLASEGFTDVPRNASFVLGGMANHGGSASDLIRDLGISKQAASQLIDTLVVRGYLKRQGNADDRRRTTIVLTDRGRAVAAAVKAAVDSIDAELAERISPAELAGLRAGLFALIDIKDRAKESSMAAPANRTRFGHFSPIFPVTDLQRALAHYAALGFETKPYADGDEYGFADRDGTGLHLAAEPGHDPLTGASATYLYVDDADALYAEWSRPGIGGTTRPVADTEYGLREGAHIDPDGNLIRFGSPTPGA